MSISDVLPAQNLVQFHAVSPKMCQHIFVSITLYGLTVKEDDLMVGLQGLFLLLGGGGRG